MIAFCLNIVMQKHKSESQKNKCSFLLSNIISRLQFLAHIYPLPQIHFTSVSPKKRPGLPGTLIKHVKTCYNNLGTKHHITGEQTDPVKDTQP